LFEVPFCTLDLETTGGSAKDCEITEIGAVKHRGGEVVGTFQTLVDPGMPIPPSIVVLTGITQAMVFDAPDIEAVLPAFLEFLGDSVIVGHNVRFDLSFLNAASTRLGYGKLANKHVDTAALARRLIRPEVRNLKLKTLSSHFRSPVTPNHRALEDARATAHVFHALLERAGTIGVTNLDDLLMLPKAKGSAHYSKIRLTEHLPRAPGVYIFKDRDGRPIYVGKATDLRARVRQYFYGDKRRTISNLMRELDSVDHQTCETVLEAEVTELRLIHVHRPRYNRKSRPPKTSHFLKVTNEAFPRLSVVRTLRDDGLAYLGPFRSKKAADLVMHAIWDAVPIRRCRNRPGTSSGKCGPAQLGIAYCPCDGTLDERLYKPVVDRLLDGIQTSPDELLGPLAERMTDLAQGQRYEEAAWLRDRHSALASALQLRAIWHSMSRAGVIRLEDSSGRQTTVDHGRFVDGSLQDLDETLIDPGSESVSTPAPPSVGAAEEARLIWRWLESEPLKLLDCTGTLALPARRIAKLHKLRAA
jgi:DNA polymerase-3 subunit epsilon